MALIDHSLPGPRWGLKSFLSAAFLGTDTHQPEFVYKIKPVLPLWFQSNLPFLKKERQAPGGNLTYRRTCSKSATKPGLRTGVLRASPRLLPQHRCVPPLPPLRPDKALHGAFGEDPFTEGILQAWFDHSICVNNIRIGSEPGEEGDQLGSRQSIRGTETQKQRQGGGEIASAGAPVQWDDIK